MWPASVRRDESRALGSGIAPRHVACNCSHGERPVPDAQAEPSARPAPADPPSMRDESALRSDEGADAKRDRVPVDVRPTLPVQDRQPRRACDRAAARRSSADTDDRASARALVAYSEPETRHPAGRRSGRTAAGGSRRPRCSDDEHRDCGSRGAVWELLHLCPIAMSGWPPLVATAIHWSFRR